MTDLDEFQRRVDSYFQCGQRNEPQGRIILDMMRALREAHAENEGLRAVTTTHLMRIQALDAENETLRTKMRRVHELNAENLADLDAMMDPTREPGSIP